MSSWRSIKHAANFPSGTDAQRGGHENQQAEEGAALKVLQAHLGLFGVGHAGAFDGWAEQWVR